MDFVTSHFGKMNLWPVEQFYNIFVLTFGRDCYLFSNHAQKWGQICYKVFKSTELHFSEVYFFQNWYFKCEICQKKVFDMNRHVARFHEMKKFYECEYCEKSFLKPSGLKRHKEQVHEGKKPFGCNYCNRNFSSKTGLKKHIEGQQWNYVAVIGRQKTSLQLLNTFESSLALFCGLT